ncbi:hypothetical protein BDW72DRAFT_194936 [Aspergillus terricola var. indicus]
MVLFEPLINIATQIFQRADDQSVRGLLESVFERLNRSPNLIDRELFLETVKKLTYYVLGSVFGSEGIAKSIREAVTNNAINVITLMLVRDRAADLAEFILHLVEAAKCYYLADGTLDVDEHVQYIEFNELDLSVAMNRHAFICQIQRLALSIIYILKNLFQEIQFRAINMSEHTFLQSDHIAAPSATYSTRKANRRDMTDEEKRCGKKEKLGEAINAPIPDADERWLFVNGIGGERFWLQLACDKLRAFFHRDVSGVFNRGDGLLWDIIECAGQRTSYVGTAHTGEVVESQQTLLDQTQSSNEARQRLQNELSGMLKGKVAGEDPYIIVIAHSQGCLLLRRALEELIDEASRDSQLKNTMKTRLCVFTFGSPSLHWKHQRLPSDPAAEGGNPAYLSSYCLRTEHFANKHDFVAQLGVLSPDNDYGADPVFKNEHRAWVGHFFGTQYSLNPEHYTNAHDNQSSLLRCRFGVRFTHS